MTNMFARGFANAISRDTDEDRRLTPEDAVAYINSMLNTLITGSSSFCCASCKAARELSVRFSKLVEDTDDTIDDACAVCSESNKTAYTFTCGHRFHVGCMKKWVDTPKSSGCPICRRSFDKMLD